MRKELSALGAWIEEKQNSHIPRMPDADLARSAGISRQQIHAIKTGQSGTKPDVVRGIATALGANAEEALHLAFIGEMRPEEELNRIMQSVPPAKRSAFIRAVRGMAEVIAA